MYSEAILQQLSEDRKYAQAVAERSRREMEGKRVEALVQRWKPFTLPTQAQLKHLLLEKGLYAATIATEIAERERTHPMVE